MKSLNEMLLIDCDIYNLVHNLVKVCNHANSGQINRKFKWLMAAILEPTNYIEWMKIQLFT